MRESVSELQSGEVVRKAVKAEAGRRTVTVPDALLDALADHLDRWVGVWPVR